MRTKQKYQAHLIVIETLKSFTSDLIKGSCKEGIIVLHNRIKNLFEALDLTADDKEETRRTIKKIQHLCNEGAASIVSHFSNDMNVNNEITEGLKEMNLLMQTALQRLSTEQPKVSRNAGLFQESRSKEEATQIVKDMLDKFTNLQKKSDEAWIEILKQREEVFSLERWQALSLEEREEKYKLFGTTPETYASLQQNPLKWKALLSEAVGTYEQTGSKERFVLYCTRVILEANEQLSEHRGPLTYLNKTLKWLASWGGILEWLIGNGIPTDSKVILDTMEYRLTQFNAVHK